jgi:hypothetical protein
MLIFLSIIGLLFLGAVIAFVANAVRGADHGESIFIILVAILLVLLAILTELR